MIPAIIAMCLVSAPTSCESHDVRVEARACRIMPIAAEAPIGGAWQTVTVSIRCKAR